MISTKKLTPSFLLAFAVLITLLWPLSPAAQSSLTIPEIMQGEKFVGTSPSGIYWSPDSKQIYFNWNPEANELADLYQTDVSGSTPTKLDPTQRRTSPGRNQVFSQDRSKCLVSQYGDLTWVDLRNGAIIQITHTTDAETNASFSADGNAIFYRRKNNFYRWSPEDGSTTQLTNFNSGSKPPEDKKETEQKEWLEKDQLAYFEILRERDHLQTLREELSDSLRPTYPRKIFLNKKTLSRTTIAPNGRYIWYRLQDATPKGNGTKVPDFVTESGYLKDLNGRPKVGSPKVKSTAYLYDRTQDTVYTIQTDSLAGIHDKPAFLEDYHQVDSTDWDPQYKKPRPVIVLDPTFNDAGTRAVLVVNSLDNKDRWLVELDLKDGSLHLLDRQRDEAWIGGPGIGGWNFASGNIGWIDDHTIYYHSEVSGYSHLYRHDLNNGEKKALTSGNFEIQQAQLSHDKSKFFIITNEVHPGEKQFYHLDINSGKTTRITDAAGAHAVVISPDEENLAIRYSNETTPWELFVMPNKPGVNPKQVTQSVSEAFAAYDWQKPELIQFRAADGVQVPARLYRPENATENGPAVIFVHGAGYLQNAHKWWSSYYREYMFHNILTDHGYTVLDVDYRGSAGYGRDWRTSIYRHMGGKDLSDQVDGATYLVEELGIDPHRIGIYGGSYGGFITLMGLFTSPETFACGAALRSVTDWAHYNDGYTSNILNTPVQDSLAYRLSSPIYHAEGLTKPLLMLHGMVDTNVQFQDVVRLSQRLIELEKDNWELAVFPMEGHGFREASSWVDEYKRIFNLFEEYLKK